MVGGTPTMEAKEKQMAKRAKEEKRVKRNSFHSFILLYSLFS